MILVFLFFGAIFSVVCFQMAKRRNRNAPIWAIFGFFLGFIPAIILAIIGNSSNPTTSSDSSSQKPAIAARSPFDDTWDTLCKYDAGVRALVSELQPFGQEAVEELKRAHQAIGDKTKLVEIADIIKREMALKREKEAMPITKISSTLIKLSGGRSVEIVALSNGKYEAETLSGKKIFDSLEQAKAYFT
jgi:hypothetical protein